MRLGRPISKELRALNFLVVLHTFSQRGNVRGNFLCAQKQKAPR